MSDESNIHLVTDFKTLPKLPKATIWDWIKYYTFNTLRKPLVWKKQKELVKIFNLVKTDLDYQVLPQLLPGRISATLCIKCKEAYGYLNNQVFMSQLASILKSLSQDKDHLHHDIFERFYLIKKPAFEKSEEISRWINNL